MITIGVDQSYTSTGCVLIDSDGNILDVLRFVSAKALDMFARAEQVANFVADTINQTGATKVAIEGLAFGIRGSATRDLAGLQYMIICTVRRRCNKDVQIVAPLTLKKFATGSGKSNKDAMYEALPDNVKERLSNTGAKKTTGRSDLTDAFWLAQYICRQSTDS